MHLGTCRAYVHIAIHTILNLIPHCRSRLQKQQPWGFRTLRCVFYLLPANKRRAWPTPTRPQAIQKKKKQEFSPLCCYCCIFEHKRKKKSQAVHNVHCSFKLSPHWQLHIIWSADIKQAEGVKRSGCAPICALKVRIDKHLQSRKRRHYANGSQAVNLNQGVFSPTLPQGLFTSFASADNSLSGGSKYRHKALPLLLSEPLLRSGSIRSHCPRRSLLPHSPSPSPPLQWS